MGCLGLGRKRWPVSTAGGIWRVYVGVSVGGGRSSFLFQITPVTSSPKSAKTSTGKEAVGSCNS